MEKFDDQIKLPTCSLLKLDSNYDGNGFKKKQSNASVAFSDIVTINPIEMSNSSDSGEHLISCINVLWVMVLFGFTIESMLRFNMSMAIVDMIGSVSTIARKSNHLAPKCYATINETMVSMNQTITSIGITVQQQQQQQQQQEQNLSQSVSFEEILLNFLKIDFNSTGFNWNEHQQGLLLASIYFSYGFTQIPGAILARRFGAKIIFGLANFVTSCLCFFIPILSYIDYRFVLLIRILQGLLLGVTWPAMHHMVAQWIPPNRRSRFFTSYMGVAVGIGAGAPLFGYIIQELSWNWIFYVCGLLGIVWYVAWLYLIYDSPAEHPRIDIEEKEYIEFALRDSLDIEKEQSHHIPWLSILTSMPVWANVALYFGTSWGMLTLSLETPTYLNNIFDTGVMATGILAGLPHFTKILFACGVSKYADRLLKSDTMSRQNVRRICGLLSNVVFGIFVIGLAFSECHYFVVILFQILGHTVNGAISASAFSNIVDLSPNYSGVIMGIVRTISVIPGFLSPFIVGHLTIDNQTSEQWKYVFLITAAVLLTTGIFYSIFTETVTQKWNTLIASSTKDKNDETS